MAKLSLMFEEKLVKEVPIGGRPVRIGRSPDNDLVVDNLAVSNDHARVYFDSGRLVVEDRGSLNGTFVNDLRVERATLHDGDSIWNGKHHIKVDATVFVRLDDKFIRGALRIRLGLEGSGNFRFGDHAGEAVGADQQGVTGEEGDPLGVDFDLGLGAEGAQKHALQVALFGLGRR